LGIFRLLLYLTPEQVSGKHIKKPNDSLAVRPLLQNKKAPRYLMVS
jgi:hypothetical protein